MSLTPIKTSNEKYQADATAVLHEAVDQGFVEVMIVGRLADGSSMFMSSATKDVQERIGTLEVMKLELFRKWE